MSITDDLRQLVQLMERQTINMPSGHHLVLTPRQKAALEAEERQPIRVLRFTVAEDWLPCIRCGERTRARYATGDAIHLRCSASRQTAGDLQGRRVLFLGRRAFVAREWSISLVEEENGDIEVIRNTNSTTILEARGSYESDGDGSEEAGEEEG